MKKKFVEPEIVRIDLNMTENIAASETYTVYNQMMLTVLVKQYGEGCFDYYVETKHPVVGHGLSTNDLVMALLMGNCFADGASKARAITTYGIR